MSAYLVKQPFLFSQGDCKITRQLSLFLMSTWIFYAGFDRTIQDSAVSRQRSSVCSTISTFYIILNISNSRFLKDSQFFMPKLLFPYSSSMIQPQKLFLSFQLPLSSHIISYCFLSHWPILFHFRVSLSPIDPSPSSIPYLL